MANGDARSAAIAYERALRQAAGEDGDESRRRSAEGLVLASLYDPLRSIGIPLGLELSATIVVNCALRLLSASALTVCATYSPAADAPNTHLTSSATATARGRSRNPPSTCARSGLRTCLVTSNFRASSATFNCDKDRRTALSSFAGSAPCSATSSAIHATVTSISAFESCFDAMEQSRQQKRVNCCQVAPRTKPLRAAFCASNPADGTRFRSVSAAPPVADKTLASAALGHASTHVQLAPRLLQLGRQAWQLWRV